MPTATPLSLWKSPQTWIIVILLAVIAAFAFAHFNKPKANRLQQASAYFDALDAEDRAKAEQEKARVAKEQAAKAEEEAKAARVQAAKAEAQAKASRQREVQQTQVQSTNNSDSWHYSDHRSWCTGTSFYCPVTCSNGRGGTREITVHVDLMESGGGWYSDGVVKSSPEALYQYACQRL
jgi:predicted membrane-bound mannosyltransferase